MDDRSERLKWFKTHILPHEAELKRVLRRIGADEDDIDDFAAEALTRAYSTADWTSVSNCRAYLHSIARNLVYDAARRRKVVSIDTLPDLEILQLADWQPTAESVVTARDELKVLSNALDQLPPRAREVFIMRRVEEISIRDIGARLGLSVKTVEAHMTRALVELTEALQNIDRVADPQTGQAWRRRDKQ